MAASVSQPRRVISGAADHAARTDELFRLTLGPLIPGRSDRERLVLRLRFVDQLTQREIGERIGVTQMQVSRILSGVLGRLRAALGG